MKIYRRILLFLVLICLAAAVTACMEPSIEEVRKKIKKELYDEYGEEFVVDRIGTRSSRGDEFYQARIYPKSIVGTPKENDEYYYRKASVEKGSFELGGVADTYGELKRSLEIENDLLGKTKELFGEGVLLKVTQRYEKRNSNGYFVSYLNPSYEKVMRKIEKQPKQHRLLLKLYVYVFKRIEDKAEKEKRREDIFEFVQYLKGEGLFKYLELGVIFMDERVLADSYDSYKWEVEDAPKVEKEIQGETVDLPPMELRKEMSEELQKEVDQMSEGELLNNMKEIRKDELSYNGLIKYNGNYGFFMKSPKLLEEDYNSYLSNGGDKKYYKTIKDVYIGRYRHYIYFN